MSFYEDGWMRELEIDVASLAECYRGGPSDAVCENGREERGGWEENEVCGRKEGNMLWLDRKTRDR